MQATLTNQNATISNYSLEILSTHVDDFEQMSYTTYGISVKDSEGTVLMSIPDISTSQAIVQDFIEKIAGQDVALIHIRDLVEDFLD